MTTAAFARPSPAAGTPRALEVRRLGRISYSEALRLQEELVARRRAGEVPDTLLLLEHPHVITLGSSSDAAHVLIDERERERLGVEIFRVGRGGGVTYHGPGQLVAYPILDLKPDLKDLHAYLRTLEEILIDVAAALSVRAFRREGLTGIWTPRGKLAAIGVRVSSQWITSHGLALNVRPDLRWFDRIVPCGLSEPVTSLEVETGATPDMAAVEELLATTFSERLGASVL